MSSSAATARSLGSYRLLHKLGTGGMAEVYLAERDDPSGRVEHVVLKAILPHLAEDERFVGMFLREARVAALLDHPNIVRVHDVSILDGRPCIVMEFLRGRDLWHVLSRFGKRGVAVSPEPAAAVIAQAAFGLDYAHRWADEEGRSLDLVHRDISPHNLFLTREGDVRVLDFGIAKTAYQQQQTEAGLIKGKLAYMAPEQARGLDVDGRADQFALGVILWEALVGARLFARDDPLQTLNALFSLDVPRPSSLRPGPPAALEDIVMRALERDPTDRFGSCEELGLALRGWLAGRGRPDEGALVRELLAAAVPEAEDGQFYGRAQSEVPESGRTRSGSEPSRLEHTPSRSGIKPSPLAKARAAEAALGAPEPSPASAPREAPAPTLRPWMLGAAIAAALLLVAAVAIVAAGSGEPEDTTTSAPAPSAATPAATPTPADALVEIRFENVPAGVVLQVDGAPFDGRVLRLLPSEASHVVRAMYGDVEVWRYEGVLDEDTSLTLPTLVLASPTGEPRDDVEGGPE